jgi:hypothetical protein
MCLLRSEVRSDTKSNRRLISMILEIWRKTKIPGLPVKFTVDEPPSFINDEGVLVVIAESPPVKKISFYETGAFSSKAFRGPCYVVQFENSNHRRVIPVKDIVDVLFAVVKEPEVAVKLEE